MDINHLKTLRLRELETVLERASQHLQAGIRVLEVGAGAGWQARRLSELGFKVEAVDMIDSNYTNVRDFPISDFDGVNIPFPDSSFDLVFTSNVLEHVRDIPALTTEFARVLVPGGVCLHIVPSATWRFWTCMTHLPYLVKRRLCRAKGTPKKASSTSLDSSRPQRGGLSRILGIVIPGRHGERSTVIGEFHLFSRTGWLCTLEQDGNVLLTQGDNGLYYSGNQLLGAALSLKVRGALARVLGSSCHFFVCSPHGEGRGHDRTKRG